MIFRQLLHEGLAAASYLIGCVAKGEAAVVDPSLSAETYTTLAAEKGLQIVAVFETHMHADFFSTGRAIAALTGQKDGETDAPWRSTRSFSSDTSKCTAERSAAAASPMTRLK